MRIWNITLLKSSLRQLCFMFSYIDSTRIFGTEVMFDSTSLSALPGIVNMYCVPSLSSYGEPSLSQSSVILLCPLDMAEASLTLAQEQVRDNPEVILRAVRKDPFCVEL